jgi:hypothetical protein
MKIHERHTPVTSAGIVIRECIDNAANGYALTLAEVFHILSEIMLSFATYAVRAERGERQIGE